MGRNVQRDELERVEYKIVFSNKSKRIIKKLSKDLSDLLHQNLKKLSIDPRIGKKLVDESNTYRLRMGDYRIIYEIDNKEITILVINFGHRKEVYKD